MSRFRIVVLSVAALSLAQAGTITTTDSPTGRATFGGNDVIDWSTLGPNFTTVSNPFTITSSNGVIATVSENSGQFQRRDQPTGWSGNFSDNLNLLWTQPADGPITMVFSTPIQGIGFQINPDSSDTAAQFQVFGAGNVLFGTFPLTTLDRSAPAADFIGVTSSAADITEIVIGLGPGQDFSINEASLIDSGQSTTPEPGGVVLVASGLALLLAGSQRGRRLISR